MGRVDSSEAGCEDMNVLDIAIASREVGKGYKLLSIEAAGEKHRRCYCSLWCLYLGLHIEQYKNNIIKK